MQRKLIIPVLLILLSAFVQQELPQVNQGIVDYTTSKIDKQVDRGECWDLARFALESANAQWTPPTTFGEKYNYKKRDILPGDIIQFEKAEFKWEYGAMRFPHHTAIVYENKGGKIITIAHQNFGGSRKVQLTELNLNYHNAGTLDFYRPQAKK